MFTRGFAGASGFPGDKNSASSTVSDDPRFGGAGTVTRFLPHVLWETGVLAYGRIPESHPPHIPSHIVPIIHPYPVPEFPLYNGAESHPQPGSMFSSSLSSGNSSVSGSGISYLISFRMSDLQPARCSLHQSVPVNHPVPIILQDNRGSTQIAILYRSYELSTAFAAG
ncbi:MAG: hypothetical protein MZV65_31270 [Chromatiales bacterium]|nr:hypothetical protein [Chromatiales bacterium]